MTTAEPPPEPTIEIRIDPGIEGGVYANTMAMMFSAHEFTLDFAVSLPAEDHNDQVIQPMRVVSRVRVAPTIVFDLMRALEANMTMYEQQFGEIRRFDAEVPLYPPDE